MSSNLQKYKNTFSLIIKELKRNLNDIHASKSVRIYFSNLYKYSIYIPFNIKFESFEIVEAGSKTYLCVKPVLKFNDKADETLLSELKEYLKDKSDKYKKDSNDATIVDLRKDGVRFRDEVGGSMNESEIVKTKAYKNLESVIKDIMSSKFEVVLIPEIFKGFSRRDLIPLLIYYKNTDELSYVYEKVWSYNPENACKRTRTDLKDVVIDSVYLKRICHVTVCNTEYSDWLIVVMPDNLKSKITFSRW